MMPGEIRSDYRSSNQPEERTLLAEERAPGWAGCRPRVTCSSVSGPPTGQAEVTSIRKPGPAGVVLARHATTQNINIMPIIIIMKPRK